MKHEGHSVPQIAKLLKRNHHTVRDWIKRYQEYGLDGLKRRYSSGRPSSLRDRVSSAIHKVIDSSPSQYGYPLAIWTALVLQDYLKKDGIETSETRLSVH
jgi:transposase